jgi:hypothetical protein
VKLHSPKFEKSLKRGVKQAIRSSKSLKAQYRIAKKAVRRRAGFVVLRPFWSLAIGSFVWLVTQATNHPVTGLGLITLYTAVVLCSHVITLTATLYRPPDLWTLFLLPMSDREIFQWESEKFLKRHAAWSLVDLVCAYGALALYLDFSLVRWMGICLLAILNWMTLLGMVCFCAARWPRGPYQKVVGGSFLSGFALLCGGKLVGPTLLHLLDSMAPAINLALPTGWCPSLFQLLMPAGQWFVALLLIPIAMIIWITKDSLAVLRSRFKFHEIIQPEVPDLIPENHGTDLDNDEAVPESHAEIANARDVPPPIPGHVGVTTIEEIILSRQFLAQEVWDGDFFQKLLWKWFSNRERVLAEFAFAEKLAIPKSWLKVLRNFLVLVVSVWVAQLGSRSLALAVLCIGIFITGAHVLGLAWSSGRTFRRMGSSGVNIPMYAVYPVTLPELSRVLFKISAIQVPMLIAYTSAAACLIAYLASFPLLPALVIGIKAGILACAARFITISLGFSAGTNDSNGLRLRSLALIFLFLGGTITFLGLGAGSLFIPHPLIADLLLILAVIDSYALFKIYAWFHATNKFDLMNMPRR